MTTDTANTTDTVELTDLTATVLNRDTGEQIATAECPNTEDAELFFKRVYEKNRGRVNMTARLEVALDDTCMEW